MIKPLYNKKPLAMILCVLMALTRLECLLLSALTNVLCLISLFSVTIGSFSGLALVLAGFA